MTAGQKAFEHTQRGPLSGALFKSALISLVILSPSLLSGIFLIENHVPVTHAYLVACLILLLAVLDFVMVVLLEPYRRRLGALTMGAFIVTISIILLFIMTNALHRFFDHLGYDYLTPFVVAGELLLVAAVFFEKNAALKCSLSLNSIALAVLWAMGAADKVTMPF